MDDDHAILKLYSMILKKSGFCSIQIATNGKEAVELYKNAVKKPYIILMDHRMPLMNGIDAMGEILHENEKIKVIFLSADVNVKETALSRGAKAFLRKPTTIRKLNETIREVMESL